MIELSCLFMDTSAQAVREGNSISITIKLHEKVVVSRAEKIVLEGPSQSGLVGSREVRVIKLRIL